MVQMCFHLRLNNGADHRFLSRQLPATPILYGDQFSVILRRDKLTTRSVGQKCTSRTLKSAVTKQRIRQQKKNKPGRVSNNTGWHVEDIPGKGLTRISHNPRLSDTHPEVALLWHPERNGSITPKDVTALSTFNAWWLCNSGHAFRRQVGRRVEKDSGCPECALESASLAARYPEIAAEWSKKNDILPNRVRYHSTALVWWHCSVEGHGEYQRTIYNRTNKTKPLGCPICEGNRPERSESLAALHPVLAKEWHSELNGEHDPYQLTPGSTIPVWWRCSKNKEHEWLSPIFMRTRAPECPYCRLWYVTDENRLSNLFPELAAEWHPKKNRFLWPNIEGSFKVAHNLRIPRHLRERNRRLRASDLAVNSDEIIWWKCREEGHEWQASVESRAIKGSKCPDCSRTNLVTKKSLLAQLPALAKQWHPTRNLPLLPSDVVPGSRQVVHWRCAKSATHVWEAPVYSVVRAWKQGKNGCRWCSGLSADDKNSLQSKFPQVAKLWHPTRNGKLLPSDVTAKSNKRVWWHCGRHEFDAMVYNIVLAHEKGANGCKFCSGRATAPENCLQRTSPEVAKMWHPTKNGSLTTEDVSRGSQKVVVWQCEAGHDWPASIAAMVQSIRLSSAAKGCPFCSGRKATSEDNFETKYPQVVRLWDAEKNAPQVPSQLKPASNKACYWRCLSSARHSWQANVSNVVIAVSAGRVPCPECDPKTRKSQLSTGEEPDS